MLLLTLPVIAAASVPFPLPQTPTPILQISCHQGECYWQQVRTVEQLRSAQGESLRRLISRAGRSVHLGGRQPPTRYSPHIRVTWERQAKVEYILCSKRRPSTVFWSADSREFVVTRLRPLDRAGYEEAAFTLYMLACHNLAPGRWTDAMVPKLGYRSQTGRQDRYKTLEQALATLR